MNRIHTGVWIQGIIFSLIKQIEERSKPMERKGNLSDSMHKPFWKQSSKSAKRKSLAMYLQQTKSAYVVR